MVTKVDFSTFLGRQLNLTMAPKELIYPVDFLLISVEFYIVQNSSGNVAESFDAFEFAKLGIKQGPLKRLLGILYNSKSSST